MTSARKKATTAPKEADVKLTAATAPAETSKKAEAQASEDGTPEITVETVGSDEESLSEVKVVKSFRSYYGNKRYAYPVSDKYIKVPSTLAQMLAKVGKVIVK